jgi:hypothetical protein
MSKKQSAEQTRPNPDWDKIDWGEAGHPNSEQRRAWFKRTSEERAKEVSETLNRNALAGKPTP